VDPPNLIGICIVSPELGNLMAFVEIIEIHDALRSGKREHG